MGAIYSRFPMLNQDTDYLVGRILAYCVGAAITLVVMAFALRLARFIVGV